MPISKGVIVIDKFTGGLNSLFHPLYISDDQSPTASNVWATAGPLTKRPGKEYFNIISTARYNNNDLIARTFGYTSDSTSNAGQCTARYDSDKRAGGVVSIESAYIDGSDVLFAFVRSLNGTTGSNSHPITMLGVYPHDRIMYTNTTTTTQGAVIVSSMNSGFVWGVKTLSASGASIWPTPVLSNTNAYILFAPITASANSVTALSRGIPFTVSSSAIGSHYYGAMSTSSAGTSDYDIGLNFSPTPSSTASVQYWVPPARPLGFLGKYYAPFLTAPTYSASAMANLGGLLQLTISDTTSSTYNATIVTATPTIQGEPVVHKNYLFVICSADNTKLQWSDLEDATTWSTNNFQYVNKQDGDPIIKLISYNGMLIIVKKRSVWSLLGDSFDPDDPQWALRRIETPPDFLAEYPEAIGVYQKSFGVEGEAGPGELKILTRYGLFTYPGGTRMERMGEDELIRPLLEQAKYIGGSVDQASSSPLIPTDTTLAFKGDYSSLFTFRNNLLLNLCNSRSTASGISDIGLSNKTYVKDYRGSWWEWGSRIASTGPELNSTQFCILKDKLLSCNSVRLSTASVSTSLGLFHWFSSAYNDIDVDRTSRAITADWTSKIFDIGYGTFETLTLYYAKQASGILTVSWRVDGNTYVSDTIDMSKGQAAAAGLCKSVLRVNDKGHSIQFKFSNAEAGVNFEIHRMECRFNPTNEEIT